MKMIGQNYSDVYCAACGEVLPTRYSGIEHEINCRVCNGLLAVASGLGIPKKIIDESLRKEVKHEFPMPAM